MSEADPMVTRWDAPSAVRAAIRAAAREDRHVLVAALALRLARLAHVKEIRVDIAGGAEAAEAVRSVLAELAARDAPGNAIVSADGAEPSPAHRTLW
jgi:hypothetical protein